MTDVHLLPRRIALLLLLADLIGLILAFNVANWLRLGSLAGAAVRHPATRRGAGAGALCSRLLLGGNPRGGNARRAAHCGGHSARRNRNRRRGLRIRALGEWKLDGGPRCDAGCPSHLCRLGAGLAALRVALSAAANRQGQMAGRGHKRKGSSSVSGFPTGTAETELSFLSDSSPNHDNTLPNVVGTLDDLETVLKQDWSGSDRCAHVAAVGSDSSRR